jgi:hypothetical protein
MYKIQPQGAGVPKRSASILKLPSGRMTRAGSWSEVEWIGNASHPDPNSIPCTKCDLPSGEPQNMASPSAKVQPPSAVRPWSVFYRGRDCGTWTDVSTVTANDAKMKTKLKSLAADPKWICSFFKRASQCRFKTSIIEPSL